MPSIFIWKANTPNTSKKTIRFYSGSNWALEDSELSSKSYMYLEQTVISESDNSVITFNSKDMPQDWTGSDLLEISSVPYEVIKSDIYGTLEHIGEWLRFTSKKEIEFNTYSLTSEYNTIKKWMNPKNTTMNMNMNTNKSNIQKVYNTKYNTNTNDSLNINKIQLDFQEFLVKYKLPVAPDIINNKPMFKHNNSHKNNYKKIA